MDNAVKQTTEPFVGVVRADRRASEARPQGRPKLQDRRRQANGVQNTVYPADGKEPEMKPISRSMERVDHLAVRLTRIHADWLLYLVWFVIWVAPGSMAQGTIDLPQRLVLILLIPFLPILTLVCWRCMRVRNLHHPYWRYPGGVAGLWLLTVLTEFMAFTILAS